MAPQTKAQEAAEAALSAIEEALQMPPDAPNPPPAGAAPPPAGSVSFELPKSRSQSGETTRPRLPQVGADELSAALSTPLTGRTRDALAVDLDALRSELVEPPASIEPPTHAELFAHAEPPPAEPLARAEERIEPVRPASEERLPLPAAPANDDRRTVGQILQAMQVRPSRTPLAIATGLSVGWAIVWAIYANSHRAALFAGDLTQIEPALALLALIGPIAFFWTVAMMTRRSQELRLTAQSMTEVAIRLAEPETIATEQVLTLSQAIRREVASMGDGIERALGRASELETIVRAEVASLERSYSENERRIRGLIDTLASEREAIVVNAEKVRNAMSGAHENLSKDLAATSLHLTSTVQEAGVQVAQSLGLKGEEVASALGATGDRILAGLASTGENVTRGLSDASDHISHSLVSRIDEVGERLRQTGEALAGDLDVRGQDIVTRIGDMSARIGDTISAHGEGIVDRLAAKIAG
mgnify:CR=1 FL=1